MNTQTQEALKMAMRGIESMFNAPDSTLFAPDWLKIYNACKEALAQPAQEPDAWTNMVFPELPNGFKHEKLGTLYDRFQMQQYAIKCLELASPPAKQPAQEPVSVKFPTMLRKMWSGTEVQEWLDKNTHPAPAREPLSEDALYEICSRYVDDLRESLYGRPIFGIANHEVSNFARAIEKAHGIGV